MRRGLPAVHVVAFGAVTPVGGCAKSSAAGARAGVSKLSIHETRINGHRQEFIGASIGAFDRSEPIAEKLRAGLYAALEEAAVMLSTGQGEAPVSAAAFVARARDTAFDASSELAWLEGCEIAEFQWREAHEVPLDECATLSALPKAIEALAENRCEVAVVAGMQSFFEEETLATLAKRGALYGEENRFGCAPAEAVGVLVLCSDRVLEARKWRSLARVVGVGTATAGDPSDIVDGANALHAAIVNAFSVVPPTFRVSTHFNNIDAERWRAEELGRIAPRLNEFLPEPGRFTTCATSWGNVGAATGALLVQQAIVRRQRGALKEPSVLVWTASSTGARAAVVLEVPGESEFRPWSVFSSARHSDLRAHTIDLHAELLLNAEMHYDARRTALRNLYKSGDFQAFATREAQIDATLDGLGAATTFLEPYIDALGEDSEPGRVFAMVAAACRQDSPHPATAALEALDLERQDCLEAVRVALAFSSECPVANTIRAALPTDDADTSHPLFPPEARAFVNSVIEAGPEQSRALLAQQETFESRPEYVSALGLLGSIGAVPFLLNALTNPSLAAPAADALELMLGAGLLGDRWDTEVLSDDALFEEELKRRRSGDTTVGVYHRQTPGVIASESHWRTWWSFHEDDFDQDTRYRRGELVGAAVTVRALTEPTWNRILRQAMMEELAVRYHNPIVVDTSMPVDAQLAALEQMRDWATSVDSELPPGRWHRLPKRQDG